MHREYHKWFSQNLGRDMEMLVFGHSGARVIVFPTQSGRFFDWEDRQMISTLSQHLDNGWLQLFCVDSVDAESWDNRGVAPRERAGRHLQYQDYIIKEVIPFSKEKNPNDFLIAAGASFGAYHSVNIALRFPEYFNRVLAMSGIYEIRPWTDGYDDELVYLGNPIEYIRGIDDEKQIENLRKLDMIIVIGRDDPAFDENQRLSKYMWERGIWHAFRVWDGWVHDWTYWQDMLLKYIGGHD